MTTISTAASVITSASTTSTSTLVKMANGEYTAASVATDQADATKLGLVREKDGNYGTASPKVAASAPAAAQASSSVQSVLTTLTLGGS